MLQKLVTVIMFLVFFVQPAVSASLETDKKIPDFLAVDSDGKKVKLSDYSGKIFVLEWTNYECPFTKKHYETGNMQNIQEYAKNKGVIWLSVISSGPGEWGYLSGKEANMKVKDLNAKPNKIIMDADGKLGKMFGAKTTPHIFIIDQEQVLRYQGAIDDAGGGARFFKADITKSKSYAKAALEQILNNEKVIINSSKPYGCAVKYHS